MYGEPWNSKRKYFYCVNSCTFYEVELNGIIGIVCEFILIEHEWMPEKVKAC
jgi:hypothetical protein